MSGHRPDGNCSGLTCKLLQAATDAASAAVSAAAFLVVVDASSSLLCAAALRYAGVPARCAAALDIADITQSTSELSAVVTAITVASESVEHYEGNPAVSVVDRVEGGLVVALGCEGSGIDWFETSHAAPMPAATEALDRIATFYKHGLCRSVIHTDLN